MSLPLTVRASRDRRWRRPSIVMPAKAGIQDLGVESASPSRALPGFRHRGNDERGSRKGVPGIASLLAMTLVAVMPVPASAEPEYEEISGYVAAEARLFPDEPLFAEQRLHGFSIVAEPEYYAEWEDRSSLAVSPFLRVDFADGERTHADIREALYRRIYDDFDLAVGVGRVFWGVTESQHLIDIVNQTDLIENVDEEDKLGQPMVNLTLLRDWGTLNVFYLPYFRERTFPGRQGRLRSGFAVDTDAAVYDSGARHWHPDFAVRYSDSRGAWDYGIHHFYGTSREPAFVPRLDPGGAVVLVPRYDLINQTGIDVQYTTGAWLWKLEALYRQGQRNARGVEENYAAWAGGFEYTFFGVWQSDVDIGVLGEWSFDTRRDLATRAFDNDLFVGSRIAFNDIQSTEILAGIVQDLDDSGRLISLEASRRIGASYRLSLEFRAFTGVPSIDLLNSVRRDDHLLVEFAYYY